MPPLSPDFVNVLQNHPGLLLTQDKFREAQSCLVWPCVRRLGQLGLASPCSREAKPCTPLGRAPCRPRPRPREHTCASLRRCGHTVHELRPETGAGGDITPQGRGAPKSAGSTSVCVSSSTQSLIRLPMTPCWFLASALLAVGAAPPHWSGSAPSSWPGQRQGEADDIEAEPGLETGPQAGTGGSPCRPQTGRDERVSPQSLGFVCSPQPHYAHSRGSPQRKSAEALSERSFFGEKNHTFCSPTPRQQVPYKPGPWRVPALLGALTPGAGVTGPSRGFILLLQKPPRRRPRSASDTRALEQSSNPGLLGPAGGSEERGPPLRAGRHAPEARPQGGVPAPPQLS